MIVTRKAIPRRAFLQGVGATLALPLLDSMVPAFAQSASAAKPVRRLAFAYTPNGQIMEAFTPATEGSGFELTPILEPFAPFRDQLLVLSGLNNNTADPLPGEGQTAPHERASGTFLTGVHPKREGEVGVSVDQIAAQELGKHTQLASLELGLHDTDVVGQCEKGWSCAYLNTLSWRAPTTPLPTTGDPRAVFERLFGDANSTDPAERLARARMQRSLLDSVTESAARLSAGLGPGDRAKLTEYLEAVRDIERRIQMAEQQSSRELPALDRPSSAPADFGEHARLMFDLEVLAFQTDMTRVVTFMMEREQSNRTFREIGVPDTHHGISHHQRDPVKIEKVTRINVYYAEAFAYFLEKLRSTPDGDGSLLDHVMIVYGGGISDGQEHLVQNLPVLLLGGGAGVRGGRHLRFPKDTPLTNLYLTLLDKIGIAVENFGDSTGKANLLSVA